MNKAKMASVLAEKMNIPKKQAEQFIENFENVVINALKNGEDVTIAGFGTFSPKIRKERFGVNPQNPKERIKMPTVTVPKFKAGKKLKDALKAK